ncbi:hypothetical protein Tco_0780783 [Tanacetum coccineum]
MDDWSRSAKSFSNPIYGYFARTNELPKNYFMFEVNYDGVFIEYPLRSEHGKKLTIKLSKSNRMIFSKMLDMLSYKLECEIWGIFVCSPRCSLEEGLTILEGAGDRVNYDDVFIEYPLRYEHGKKLTIKLSKSNRMIFSKMLDMLSYKLECEIWGIFVCSPRCSLEEGLTILEGDGDMNKLYDIAEKYGLINLYIAHLSKNLAEYYFKILTLDVSDEEVKSKLKSHEKRKLDSCCMSPHELLEWEEQEAGSPYLRTPPLKPRRKGLAVDDVGGSSIHIDLVHENIVYNDLSLPSMDKERFSNNVVLDDVVTDTLAYTLPFVLKKKCRNKVNVTRKTRCLKNSKTMRLRKGCGKRVAIGGHGRGLGRLIGLNVAAVDDDPQCIPGMGDTYLPYNLSRVVAHTSPVVTRSSSSFLD